MPRVEAIRSEVQRLLHSVPFRPFAFTRLAVCLGGTAVLLLVIGALRASAPAHDDAKPPKGKDKPKPARSKDDTAKKDEPKPGAAKLGLALNDARAFQGYTLLAPMESSKTYLIDMQGKVVRTWESDCAPALCPLLLENGHLLRPGSIGNDSRVFGPGPGVGGRIQEFTWEGALVWDFKFYNARQLPHHDMTRLPNGNVLLIVSDRKTAEEGIAAGRRPEMTGDGHLLPDSLVEIRPTGKTTGEVVWEWHLWDHLVQDFDKSKANYGDVAAHPELVNINYGEDELSPPPAAAGVPALAGSSASRRDSSAKAGPNNPKSDSNPPARTTPSRPPRVNPDWTHFNGVAYNPELDQIAVSVHAFSEFWILDHSTTTAEAAGHAGGRSGKGGDLLYRWGNPRAYRAGTKANQKLFSQHNAHWIPRGLPGEGHLLVFNNGNGRADGSYSSVDELILPVDSQGRYASKPGTAYGPEQPVWSYAAAKKTEFYSTYISGAQRLANGNTLICSGANGTIFEVTPQKEIVWKYVNPVKRVPAVGPGPRPGELMSTIAGEMLGVSAAQRKQLDEIQKDVDARLGKLLTADQTKRFTESRPGPGAGPAARPGQIIASSEANRLKLTDAQKKDLAALQKVVDERFDKVLNAAQKKQLKSVFAPSGPPPRSPSPGGAGSPQAGKILSAAQQDSLKLSSEQKKQLEEIQKEVDAKLAKLLTEDQRKQLRAMQGPAAGAAAGPGGPGRGGPPGGAPLFRAYRYATNYPGFAGKELTAGKTVEELQRKEPEKREPKKKN
jgi:Arylsulfotransferase (ASST)